MWNLSSTSFLASSSNFATSSSSFQISYSFAIFLTFIILFFFDFSFFFFFFSFFCSFSSYFLSASFCFPILIFSTSASTTSHILLDILSSLLLLSSSQFQDCNKLAMAFPKLCSTFVFLSHQSLFFLCVSNNKY